MAIVLGSSGIPAGETYATQMSLEHVKASYFYGQASPTYSQISYAPLTQVVAFQTKGTTRASYDAMLKTFPATRTGKILLHYQNEIDRHVHLGDLTLADAQARIDALYAAIKASGKTYVVPTLGIQYWCLQNYNAGNLGANHEWDFPEYMRPGLRHILFSSYADPQVKNGQTVYQSPLPRAQAIDNLLDQHLGINWTLVFGYPIPSKYITNQPSLDNRAKYLQDAFDTYSAMRHPPKRMLWFDYDMGDPMGDERLREPTLNAKWLALCKSLGQ